MKCIFLGIAQGLTEFLPISSSGHLYLIKNLLNINGDYFSFFIFLHIATLIAVLIFFRRDLKIFKNLKLVLQIILICLITGVIGLGVKFCFKRYFGDYYFLSFCFFVNALILFSQKSNLANRNWKDMNFKDSLVIGLLQGLSPLPGISRSGITIVTLLRRGFSKNDSFMLSFLMAIPLMLGVFILDLKDLIGSDFSIISLTMGFIFAFLSGILALRIVKRVVIMEKMSKFAYYSWAISLFSLGAGIVL